MIQIKHCRYVHDTLLKIFHINKCNGSFVVSIKPNVNLTFNLPPLWYICFP